MPQVKFILPDDEVRIVEAQDGTSVMHAALSNLVPGIIGECGGEMSCATCHVYVEPTWTERISGSTDEEVDMLQVTAAEPTENSRLSCQIRCTSETHGIVVHVPELQ